MQNVQDRGDIDNLIKQGVEPDCHKRPARGALASLGNRLTLM
jgi:hypothetical protein